MTSFLRSIAEAYTNHYNDLSNFCFVFPNKRSGSFFLKHLNDLIKGKVALSPKIMTISDFVAQTCKRDINNRLDLLFLLYKEYTKLIDENIEFDKFRAWGDTILSDFNEVDMSCVNPDSLFKNIKDYKEIQANYLTEQQQEIINDYFGNNDPVNSTQSFWNHFNTQNNSESKNRFLKIWETLAPLYHSLNNELESRSMTYTGGAYRLAYQNICENGKDAFSYSKIIFIGFNVLSTIEYNIFSKLQNLNNNPDQDFFADFYWDCTGPALSDKNNNATKFILKNKEIFKSHFDISSSDTDSFPSKIEAFSCPSNSYQAKKIGEILYTICDENSDINKLTNTAVILPDEELLLPLLHSFPENMPTANLTMGYPIKLTATASFAALLRKAYDRASSKNAETFFYFEDVKAILSHPYANVFLDSKSIENIKKAIVQQHLFNISTSQLEDFSNRKTSIIFSNLSKNASAQETIIFLDNIFSHLLSLIENESSKGIIRSKIEVDCIIAYREALARLSDSISTYDIKMTRNTLLILTDRLLSTEKVTFEGEPLKGVQIMGILESRCLDFDNIIIPSMNERVFPRKMRTRSFIPNSLRQGYGMPTLHFQESIFAYYFYRMISRAKKVHLLFDSRTSGLKSGDHSRYISQLKHLYPKSNIDIKSLNFEIKQRSSHPLNIDKTGAVAETLNKFLTTDSKSKKYLSASSLKNYLICPLLFYFRNIENIDSDIEPSEFMDAITIGNIFHKIMQDLYTPDKNEVEHELNPGKAITPEFIDSILADENMLRHRIDRYINQEYSGKKSDSEPQGNAMIFRNIIFEYIKSTLLFDKSLTPFIYKGSEVKNKFQWQINPDLKVNIIYIIDRLDIIRVDDIDTLRIVDYKTGGDNTNITTLNEIFDDKNYSAIFQLLLYANLYAEHNNYTKAIKPVIYKVQNFAKNEMSADITLKKSPINDYKNIPTNNKKNANTAPDDFNREFVENIKHKIEEIFNPNLQFTQTTDSKRCEYCDFRQLCNR